MRKTRIVVSCLAALMLLGTASPCTVNAAKQPDGGTVDIQREFIEYVYKEYPDGSLYKRLYNFSRDMWVGDWIKIRDAYK